MGKNSGEAAEDSNVQGPSDVKADDADDEGSSDIQKTSTDVQANVQEGESGVQDEPGDVYDSLWMKKWQDIPNAPYFVKYIFSKDCYTILITNLCDLYGENLTANEVQERFSILNPHAEMKSNVIMKYLKEELEKFLEEKNLPEHDTENLSKFSYQCSSKTTAFELIFKVHQVSFAFEIKPQLLPSEKFRAHVIAPTIFASHSMLIDIVKCKYQWPRPQSPNPYHKHEFEGDILLKKKSQIPEKEVMITFSSLQRCIQLNIVNSNELLECSRNPYEAEDEAKTEKGDFSTQVCSISAAEEFKSSATSMKRPSEVSEATEGASSSKDELVLKKKKKKFNF